MVYCIQDITQWLKKKIDKYMSPEIQNKMSQSMCHAILRALVKQVQQADYFTIMLDECVNSSDNELLAICITYVDINLVAYEEFIGLYRCPDIKANSTMGEATLLVPEME